MGATPNDENVCKRSANRHVVRLRQSLSHSENPHHTPMPIAHSLRFRFLDLGKQILFTIKWLSACAPVRSGSAISADVVAPETGHKVESLWEGRSVTGWFVPHRNQLLASVLLFHGIGDRSSYWRRAQQVLAEAGISSLVFEFPGYGGNRDAATPANMEDSARAAYRWLNSHGSEKIPTFLLGFSLGSGLAAEVAQTLRPLPSGVILAEAFTSLQDGARRAARPLPFLGYLIPNVWKTRDNVARMSMPVLVIHSDGDSLFPVSMAEELHTAAQGAGVQAELRILHGHAHDAPYRTVPEDYWAEIVEFIERTAASRQG